MHGRKLAWFAALCFTAGVVACSSDEPHDPPAAFRGAYAVTADDGSKRGSITFDATTFTAVVDAKAFNGFYRYDDSANALQLTDEETGTKTVWNIGSLHASKGATAPTSSSLRPQGSPLPGGDRDQGKLLDRTDVELLVTTTLAKIKSCTAQASKPLNSAGASPADSTASLRPRDELTDFVGAIVGALCPGHSAGDSSNNSSEPKSPNPPSADLTNHSPEFSIARTTSDQSSVDERASAINAKSVTLLESFGLNVTIERYQYASQSNDSSEVEAAKLHGAIEKLVRTPTFQKIIAPAYRRVPNHSVALLQTRPDDLLTWAARVGDSPAVITVTMTVGYLPKLKPTALTASALAIAIAHELAHNIAVGNLLREDSSVASTLKTLVPARTDELEQVPIAIELLTGNDLGGLRIADPARYVTKP